MARNAVLVPISQGTEVTIITKYVPFRYFTSTASIYIDISMGTSSITPCYDMEQLETKTHVGLVPGESIEYIKNRVSLEGHPWPGCRPGSDTCRPYNYGQTKQKRRCLWWNGLGPMGHCNPEEECANVIASTNHLEILCFVTGPPLAWLPKPTKICSDFLYEAERSMYILKALTGQSRDSWLPVGGENAERVITRALNGGENTLGT